MGEFHFLTFSCYRRRPYLSTVAAMELFEDALERVRLRYLFAVAGYVVMPEHVHLLVNEPDWLLAAIFSVKEGDSTPGSDRSRARRAPVNQKRRLFEGIEVQSPHFTPVAANRDWSWLDA